MIIDLTERTTEGQGMLSRIAVRRDGTSEDDLLFDADIGFEIQSSDDAKIISKLIPGASELYEQVEAGDERKTTIRASLADRSVHVELCDLNGEVLAAGPTEIRSVVYKADPVAVYMTVRFRFFGISEDKSGQIVNALGRRVAVLAEHLQQVFDYANPGDTPIAERSPDMNDVVTFQNGEDHEFGMVVGEGNGQIEVSNFTSVKTIDDSTVVSRISVTGEAGVPLATTLMNYHMECRTMDVIPNWQWLLLALGETYATAEETEAPLVIDGAVIALAVSRARSVLTPDFSDKDRSGEAQSH